MNTLEAMDEVEDIVLGPDEGVMRILDPTGDSVHKWNRHNDAEVQAARQTFDLFKSKGYTPYRLDASEQRSGVMNEFDSTAERVVFSPRMVGG